MTHEDASLAANAFFPNADKSNFSALKRSTTRYCEKTEFPDLK